MGPSGNYERWHPLEWLCKDPKGLFVEFRQYRNILAASVLARSDNTHSAEETQRILDQIHMRYLVKHAPDSAMGFIIEQQLSGADFEQYWPRHEIQLPLVHGAAIGSNPSAGSDLAPIIWSRNQRHYVLHPDFYEPEGVAPLSVRDLSSLIEDVERYDTTKTDQSVDELAQKNVLRQNATDTE